MENVMTKGFCELNENEIMRTEGGRSARSIYKQERELYYAQQAKFTEYVMNGGVLPEEAAHYWGIY
jgi:hypothetical protein